MNGWNVILLIGLRLSRTAREGLRFCGTKTKTLGEDPLLKAENSLNTILQITVSSCFACATQLADLFPNVGRSFFIGIPN